MPRFQAVQWDGYNLAYILGFMYKRLDTPISEDEIIAFNTIQTKYRDSGFVIETLDGKTKIDVNDWIIKNPKGEFYACAPDIFETKYSQVIEA